MIVWVASYPRSGNTLTTLALRDAFGVTQLGTVYEEHLGFGSFCLPDGLGLVTPALSEELRELGDDELLEALRARPETYFVKTHRLAQVTDPAPALHIVRDGRDALVSHAHFIASNIRSKRRLGISPDALRRYGGKSFEECLDMLIAPGAAVTGTWSQSVREWRRRQGPVAQVRFEELIEDPAAVVAAACAELGVMLQGPSGAPLSFEALHRATPHMFRRGSPGAWREEMPARLESRFWRAHGPQMTALGYAR